VGRHDYEAGRFARAAQIFERTARLRTASGFTPGLLYWAARSHQQLGEAAAARQLFDEVVQRFKHSYYGLQASLALGGAARPAHPRHVLRAGDSQADAPIPEPHRTRLRELVLIHEFVEARRVIEDLNPTPLVTATVAWLEWRGGRYRQGLAAMKAAYPEHVGVAGDDLPRLVWEIIYPLAHAEHVKAQAAKRNLDPALVAALIRQESTFDTNAVSRAGARGLMQIMPATGRRLARSSGLRYRRSLLHDPQANITMGTLYLRQMLDRFGGRVEQALAAYNAGPHRVDAWTVGRSGLSAEEFIESIPFTETRSYVKTVLSAREQYRRIYALAPPSEAGPTGARP
jgi:soluble lytic murein transglycosylase